jgi:uncharacterized protein (TIGR03435 family)
MDAMKKTVSLALLSCLFLAIPLAFPQATKNPEFEVASVKPTPGNPTYIRLDPKPERFVAEHVPLKVLIGYAYGLQGWQIVGGPGWAESVRDNPKWDVEAKPPAPATTAEMRLMVQALLADRFRLRVHKETRPGKGYSLVTAGRRQALKESVAECPIPPTALNTCGGVYNFGGNIAPREVGERASMAQLVEELSRVLGTVVQDNTGLTGVYDFTLQWKPESDQPGVGDGRFPYSGDPNASSLFQALQDQLGLKLQAAKVPLDILVIDSAERASEN